jgi:hypothetical protein
VPDPTAGERDLDRLRLLAVAVAGHSLDVGAAPGDRAWTDGATIFIDPTADRAEQVRTLCVQASLLAAGSLGPDVVGLLARRPSLTRRYLAIEGHRALAANDDVLPRAVRSLVDPDVARRTTSPEASLALARGDRAVGGDPPPSFGAIHPRRMRAAAEQDAPGQARVAPGLARRTDGERALDELDDGDDEAGADLGSLVSSPVGGGGPVGRLLQRLLLRPARARGDGPPGADAPTHAARATPGAGRRAALASGPTGTLDEAPEAPEPAAFTYPEWDVHRRRYRPGWCVVVEGDPPGTADTPAAVPDRPALRPPLARLGLGLTRCRRQPQGDDIDLDAAVEARVDALAGAPPHEDVYLDSLRRRRDLAVLVLLDVSGSAGEPAAVGGRTVHDHQRAIAAALTGALHDLGDRVALYAFNSRGRTAVHVMRIKAFDDVLDGRVARRLDGVAPAAYTRLGAAIRHGTALLEARGGTPGASWWSCRTGSPTTTATTGATARPTHAGRCSRRGAGASAASASAWAPTPTPRRCGASSAPPPTRRCPVPTSSPP